MKKSELQKVLGLVLSGLILTYSCGRMHESDSRDLALKANEDKFSDPGKEADANFVAEMVAANYGELELARIAGNRSSNDYLVDVANSIEREKKSMLHDLQSIALKKGMYIPTGESAELHKKIGEVVREQNETQFDRSWCALMIDNEKHQIDQFTKLLARSDDSELKKWVSEELPKLRNHESRVTECNKVLQANR